VTIGWNPGPPIGEAVTEDPSNYLAYLTHWGTSYTSSAIWFLNIILERFCGLDGASRIKNEVGKCREPCKLCENNQMKSYKIIFKDVNVLDQITLSCAWVPMK
jgi:hypothetical protein